ncbi:unnamed protein product [Cyclocybe aegerita]|uniref:Uncharacterized protein n=1 Tax=Cyclocybe aegerita TaxID=1973307 RepID=A0A8S0XMG8_CYCAE|nr:unnamed protein product [Cyclocybe aegerita]
MPTRRRIIYRRLDDKWVHLTLTRAMSGTEWNRGGEWTCAAKMRFRGGEQRRVMEEVEGGAAEIDLPTNTLAFGERSPGVDATDALTSPNGACQAPKFRFSHGPSLDIDEDNATRFNQPSTRNLSLLCEVASEYQYLENPKVSQMDAIEAEAVKQLTLDILLDKEEWEISEDEDPKSRIARQQYICPEDEEKGSSETHSDTLAPEGDAGDIPDDDISMDDPSLDYV